MPTMNADIDAVRKQYDTCKRLIEAMRRTSSNLNAKYTEAGRDWSDERYRQLGTIIIECREALDKSAKQVELSLLGLDKVISDLNEYDSINFAGNSGENSSVSGLFGFRNQMSSSSELSPGIINQILSPPLVWRQISGEHDYSSDLAATNPNWSQGYEWQNNCQRCVPTYEMRQRGYDVTARPLPDSEYDSLSDRNHVFEVWNNPSVISCGGSGLNEIRNAMNSWGDGSRAQIVIFYRDGGGHTFVAEQVNGSTHFYDPQTAQTDLEYIFDDVISGETQFCRIDNVTPSYRIYNVCEEVQNNG